MESTASCRIQNSKKEVSKKWMGVWDLSPNHASAISVGFPWGTKFVKQEGAWVGCAHDFTGKPINPAFTTSNPGYYHMVGTLNSGVFEASMFPCGQDECMLFHWYQEYNVFRRYQPKEQQKKEPTFREAFFANTAATSKDEM